MCVVCVGTARQETVGRVWRLTCGGVRPPQPPGKGAPLTRPGAFGHPLPTPRGTRRAPKKKVCVSLNLLVASWAGRLGM